MTTDTAQPKMPRWLMGQNPAIANDPVNYLTHMETPRFTARWCFGAPTVAPKDGECIFVEDGEGDAVHVYDYVWIDKEPSGKAFKKMMTEAVDAIDQWLENNMAPPTREF